LALFVFVLYVVLIELRRFVGKYMCFFTCINYYNTLLLDINQI
jgi:hypothetical protein